MKRLFLTIATLASVVASESLVADEDKKDENPTTGNSQAGVITKGVEDIGYHQDWKNQEKVNEQINKEFEQQQNIDQRYIKEGYEEVNKRQNEVNRNQTEHNNAQKDFESKKQAEIDAGKQSADANAEATRAEREANKLEKDAANAKKNKDPNAGELENKAKKARENANSKRTEANNAKQKYEKSKIETDNSATKVKESGKKLENSKKELTKSQKKLESRKNNSAKRPKTKTKPTVKGTMQKAGNMAGNALYYISLGSDARDVQLAYQAGDTNALRKALIKLGYDIADNATFGLISATDNTYQLVVEVKGQEKDWKEAEDNSKNAQAQDITKDLHTNGMPLKEAQDLAEKYANGTATPEEKERVETAYKNMNDGEGKDIPGLQNLPTDTGWSNMGTDIKKTFTSWDHFKGKAEETRNEIGEQVVKTTDFVVDGAKTVGSGIKSGGEAVWTAITGTDHSGIEQEGQERVDENRIRLENKLIKAGFDPDKAHEIANKYFDDDPEAKKIVRETSLASNKKLRDNEAASNPDPEGGNPDNEPGSIGGLGTFLNDMAIDIAKKTGEQFGINDQTIKEITQAWENALVNQTVNNELNAAGDRKNETEQKSAVDTAKAQDDNSLTTKLADAGEDAFKQGLVNAVTPIVTAAADNTKVPGEKDPKEEDGPPPGMVPGGNSDPTVAHNAPGGGGRKPGGKKGGNGEVNGEPGGEGEGGEEVAKNGDEKKTGGGKKAGGGKKGDGKKTTKNDGKKSGSGGATCIKCGVSLSKIPQALFEKQKICEACHAEEVAEYQKQSKGGNITCDKCKAKVSIAVNDSFGYHILCHACEAKMLREKAGMTSKSGNKTGNGSRTVHFCGKCSKACTDGHKDYMGYAFLCSSCSATVTQVNPNASSSSTGSSGSGKVNGTYSSSSGPANKSDPNAFTCSWCGKKSTTVVSGVGSGVYCSNACYQKFLDSRKQSQGTSTGSSKMREYSRDRQLRDPLKPAPDFKGIR